MLTPQQHDQEAHKTTALVKTEAKPKNSELSLEGDLNLSDYILQVEPSERTRQAVYAWAVQKQEATKEKLLTMLVKIFGGTLAASVLLTVVAVANPNVDKSFIKDVIPLLIGPQATLFGGAFGAYVLRSKAQKKE